MPGDLIIYAVVAVALVVWLRSVLGTRHEGDEPASPVAGLPDLEAPKMSGDIDGVKELSAPTAGAEQQLQYVAKDKTGVIKIEAEAEAALRKVIEADPTFSLKFFFSAVQDVFAMVVEAFADGDRDALEDMLIPQVYQPFSDAIDAREAKGHRASAEVHAIEEAYIIDAALEGRKAYITVRFVADQSSCVRDEAGNVIEGDPARNTRMIDIWVFSRDLKSRDPRWMVVETRGDFDGDNDFVPNA